MNSDLINSTFQNLSQVILMVKELVYDFEELAKDDPNLELYSTEVENTVLPILYKYHNDLAKAREEEIGDND